MIQYLLSTIKIGETVARRREVIMAFQAIEAKIRHNSTLVLEKAGKMGKLPR